MPTPSRTYRRTEAGRKAWDTQNTAVPLDYRRVLGVIGEERDFDSLHSRLARYSRDALAELLDELEQQGYVQSFAPDPTDLDFTGNFRLADLRKAHEELDFTDRLRLEELRAAHNKKK